VREPRVPLLRPDDEERRRLLPATVPAGRLSGVEAVEQTFGQRLLRRRLEGLRERVHRLPGDEDVALRRVARAGAAARPVAALVTGVRGCATLAVDDTELALRPELVGPGQS